MREYLLVFLVAAAVTYLLTVVAREIALRSGAVAKVRDRDVHDEPIPYLGGLAMLGGLVAAYLVARELPFLSASAPLVFRDAGIVLIAGALICAVGVLDDLFELDALTKLGGQVLAAGFLVAFGIQFFFFTDAQRQPVLARPGPGRAAHRAAGRGDRQRGQLRRRPRRPGRRRGRHRRARLLRLLLQPDPAQRRRPGHHRGAAQRRRWPGSASASWSHNFHPARLFMGDSGSMLIGLVLSASAVTLSGQFTPEQLSQGGGGSAASLLPDAAAGAAADLAADRAARRPGAGRRTPHPGRPVAVRARTSSTCTTGCSRSATASAGRC